ncbi:MAG: NYN domain-containing protein [Labrys sp. (in: a-proteobacteria)]
MTPHAALAVLIDAENLSVGCIASLPPMIAGLGSASIRRIYGDFGRVAPQWQAFGQANGFVFRHTPATVPGKNTADIALIIEAIEIGLSAPVDGVCIASSDSDFSAVAIRLRERGLPVYGLVEAKAGDRLRAAFTRVFDLTAPRPAQQTTPKPAPAPVAKPAQKSVAQPAQATPPGPRRVKLTPQTVVDVAGAEAVLVKAFQSIRPRQDWVPVQALHEAAVRQLPQFHPSQFGRATMASLVNSLPAFRIETASDGKQRRVALRLEQPAEKTAPTASR